MSFFSKISNVWKSESLKETEAMKTYKKQYNEACVKEKELEHEIVKNKRNKADFKSLYQHECPHKNLTKSNSSNSNSLNDYYARCSHCKAELYDHAGALNYLNTLIDLLSKYPKMMESYKLVSINGEKAVDPKRLDEEFGKVRDIIADLIYTREVISSYKSNEYNDAIKANIIDRKDDSK